MKFSLTNCFFSTISFSFQMFVLFPFSSCNWFLISYYHSGEMLDIISILLNLLKLLYPHMWFVLRIFCKHLKRMSILLFWMECPIDIRSNWCMVTFKTTAVSTDFPSGWSVHWCKWWVKILHLLSISPYMSVYISFTYLGASVLSTYIYIYI